MRTKLTAKIVDEFRVAESASPAFLWDTEAKGLGVKASPGGSKKFVLEGRLHGKTLRLTIGDTRTWPLDGPAGKTQTARAEARRLMSLIDQGIDPRKLAAEAKQKAVDEEAERERQSITLASAWQTYIEHRQYKWSERHKADHEEAADPGGKPAKRGKRLTKPGILASLMPLKLANVDAEKIESWLRREAEVRPTRARHAFNMLRTFINWCETQKAFKGIISPDAAPSRFAKEFLPRKAARDDCLQRGQLRAWFGAVLGIQNPVISAYLQILLLTGARRESLAMLKWDEVDFRWNKLTIRDKEESRGGENGTRAIPLTPYVAQLLQQLHRINRTPPPTHRILHGKRIENDLENWRPSPWVFFSKTSASGRLRDPTLAHRKACTQVDIHGLTLHGLRRSFATLSEWVECPTGIVAQIMGHKPSATAERHYKRRPIELLHVWHTKIESWILEQAGVTAKTEKDEGISNSALDLSSP